MIFRLGKIMDISLIFKKSKLFHMDSKFLYLFFKENNLSTKNPFEDSSKNFVIYLFTEILL